MEMTYSISKQVLAQHGSDSILIKIYWDCITIHHFQRSSRLPDLRRTLFWLPNVNSKQVSFYTGDNKGRFLAVLQGINAAGRAINISSEIEVR